VYYIIITFIYKEGKYVLSFVIESSQLE